MLKFLERVPVNLISFDQLGNELGSMGLGEAVFLAHLCIGRCKLQNAFVKLCHRLAHWLPLSLRSVPAGHSPFVDPTSLVQEVQSANDMIGALVEAPLPLRSGSHSMPSPRRNARKNQEWCRQQRNEVGKELVRDNFSCRRKKVVAVGSLNTPPWCQRMDAATPSASAALHMTRDLACHSIHPRCGASGDRRRRRQDGGGSPAATATPRRGRAVRISLACAAAATTSSASASTLSGIGHSHSPLVLDLAERRGIIDHPTWRDVDARARGLDGEHLDQRRVVARLPVMRVGRKASELDLHVVGGA